MTALLKPKEVAVRLGGISKDTVYDLIADGELDSVDVRRPNSTQSRLRVPEDSVEAFIEKRRRNARQPERRRSA